MTTVPRLLIADWITTFARLKTALCIPAGKPIPRILSRHFRLIVNFFISR